MATPDGLARAKLRPARADLIIRAQGGIRRWIRDWSRGWGAARHGNSKALPHRVQARHATLIHYVPPDRYHIVQPRRLAWAWGARQALVSYAGELLLWEQRLGTTWRWRPRDHVTVQSPRCRLGVARPSHG